MTGLKTKLAVLGIVALTLVGCSAINSGEITSKDYKNAYDIPVSYCMIYKTGGGCQVYGTRYDHYPAQWKFNLKLEDKTGWVYVPESVWNEYEVGDFYNTEAR